MMESAASNAVQMPSILARLIPTIGPLFLISVGYMDPGKWAALIDGGSRFGFDFVLLVLVFNFTAILCQSLAAHIGVVTGKDLAQICGEEYTAPICISLGIQIELSALVLDLTMTTGIAHGLNVLLGLDLLSCILVSFILGALILLYLDFQYLDKQSLVTISMCTAGFIMLCYVLVVLGSQPEVPFVMNGILPKLRGESLYAVMAFLGASILPHNFYLHSSLIQKQQWTPNLPTGTLCYDHVFAIIIVFSAIFLVNYVIMNVAVSTFHSAGLAVLTFQDALLLLDQVLKSSMASFVFFLALLLASLVTSLTCTFNMPALLHGLVGPKIPVWMHPLRIKVLAMLPAIYSVYNYGAEGIYQLLVLSQIVLALQLPSSVIPLFRVASSSAIMGSFKIPAHVETLSFLAFFGMLSVNILFVIEMLFGDSEWVSSLNVGGSITLPFIFVLVTACMPVFLMLWLAVTPLKSASEKPDSEMLYWETQSSIVEPSVDKEDLSLERSQNDGNLEFRTNQHSLEKSIQVVHPDKVIQHEAFVEDSRDSNLAPMEVDKDQINSSCSAESISVTRLSPVMDEGEIPLDELSDVVATRRSNLVKAPDRTKEIGIVVRTEKDGGERGAWTPDILSAEVPGSSSLATSEGTESLKSIMGKNDDISSGSPSLSRLSGLGRAARRQLASILDEFWGQLYDFHGQITSEAKAKRMDVVLGLRPPLASPAVEEWRSVFMSNSVEYDSFLHSRKLGTADYSYGIQGSPSWSSSMQSFDSYMQGSSRTPAEVNERHHSSLHFPAYSESRDYQPATIHGYQLSSYLRRMGTDLLEPPVPGPNSFAPNYSESTGYGSIKNGFGSFRTGDIQNWTLPNMLPTDVQYSESTLTSSEGEGEGNVSSAYSKKYHSLPDISGLGISRWGQSSVVRNSQRMGTIGPGQPVISQNRLRAERVPLAFDELSPSKLHRDAFSLQTNSHMETNSLWSRQPFEQLFGRDQSTGVSSGGTDSLIRSSPPKISHADAEVELLQSFRFCIVKLLRLEGSEWLFQQNGGSDEELIDLVAAREKFLQDVEGQELTYGNYTGETLYSASDRKFVSGSREDDDRLAKLLVSTIPHCGDGCMWKLGLIISFGVWCIHRILDLALVESRPELWGKYTYVLNRLQGILDLAFSQPRPTCSSCLCLQIPASSIKLPSSKLSNALPPITGEKLHGRCTSSSTLLEIIKDVETSVASRKGRTGTAAGDVAFPKGKENLASVLKRYKRRLSNKSAGTQGGSSGSSKGIPSVGQSLLVS